MAPLPSTFRVLCIRSKLVEVDGDPEFAFTCGTNRSLAVVWFGTLNEILTKLGVGYAVLQEMESTDKPGEGEWVTIKWAESC